MNELEVIRREIEALPGPDEAAMVAARAALRREIEAWPEPEQRRRRSRRLLIPLALAATLAIALIALFAIGIPANGPVGVRIAAAADEALNPSNGDIVHASSQTLVTYRSKVDGKTTTSRSADESWAASGPPYALLDRYGFDRAKGLTILTTSCGQISYDPTANLFSVSPMAEPIQILRSDPASTYRDAYRHGRVHYLGKTTFHGIPAFRLDVTRYGEVSTLIVRRDNDYPLETTSRRETARSVATYVTTYSTFEHLKRTPSSERLLQLTPHAGAFFVRVGKAATSKKCKDFGSLQSLTEKNAKP